MAWFELVLGILFGFGMGITVMALLVMAKERDAEMASWRTAMQPDDAAIVADRGESV